MDTHSLCRVLLLQQVLMFNLNWILTACLAKCYIYFEKDCTSMHSLDQNSVCSCLQSADLNLQITVLCYGAVFSLLVAADCTRFFPAVSAHSPSLQSAVPADSAHSSVLFRHRQVAAVCCFCTDCCNFIYFSIF